MKHLVVMSILAQAAQDRRLQNFAAWMGVQTEEIIIVDQSGPSQQIFDQLERAKCCVAMSIDTLTAVHRSSSEPARLHDLIQERCAELLVFGCSESPEQGTTLSWLTSGAVRRVTSSEVTGDGGRSFHFPPSCREFSQQFAGLSFPARCNASLPVFELNVNESAVQTIMLADDRPVFLRLSSASCQTFLLAGSDLPDIDQSLSRDQGIEEYYDRIIPFLILLRYCFGRQCWHGPESTARLIVDDPLLADRYGFLDYSTLLTSMQREHYGTSIAFIPWNYRRTSQRTAGWLSGKEAYVSVCVHGCDHTNKEFDSPDQDALMRKAGLALERMEQHQVRTQLPFERVMVFPQGRFSTSALLALRAANYLAAVNSTCFPTDDAQEPLRIADFLRVAITRFHGFPIFIRRYPRQLIDFAFDIFLGRPVFVVEHHQYFRDGCGQLEEFVGKLRTLEPSLSWPTLSSQLVKSCMMRYISDDLIEVQFYTRRFQIKNTMASRCRFILEKDEPEPSAVSAVLVDGNGVSFSVSESRVRFEIEIDPGEQGNIEIVDHRRPLIPKRQPGVTYSLGVLLRRSLSEFRDNTLARHPGLLRVATGLVRGLKVTGDRSSGK